MNFQKYRGDTILLGRVWTCVVGKREKVGRFKDVPVVPVAKEARLWTGILQIQPENNQVTEHKGSVFYLHCSTQKQVTSHHVTYTGLTLEPVLWLSLTPEVTFGQTLNQCEQLIH